MAIMAEGLWGIWAWRRRCRRWIDVEHYGEAAVKGRLRPFAASLRRSSWVYLKKNDHCRLFCLQMKDHTLDSKSCRGTRSSTQCSFFLKYLSHNFLNSCFVKAFKRQQDSQRRYCHITRSNADIYIQTMSSHFWETLADLDNVRIYDGMFPKTETRNVSIAFATHWVSEIQLVFKSSIDWLVRLCFLFLYLAVAPKEESRAWLTVIAED